MRAKRQNKIKTLLMKNALLRRLFRVQVSANPLCKPDIGNRGCHAGFATLSSQRSEISANRFWAKVDKNGSIPSHRPDLGPCWDWTAALNSKGYGCFGVSGVSQLSHRVSVVLDGREIPDGLTVDHLCRNIACVNPGHLEVVTLAENNRRQPIAQGNHCRRGHEFTPQNTITKHGRRNCRICTRMKRVEWDASHPRTTQPAQAERRTA